MISSYVWPKVVVVITCDAVRRSYPSSRNPFCRLKRSVFSKHLLDLDITGSLPPSSISLPTATCIHGFRFLVLCNSAPRLSTFASPTNSLESPTSLILFLTQIISLSIQPSSLQVTIVISFLDTSTTTSISTSTSWRYITVRPGKERYSSFPSDGTFESESAPSGPPKQSIGLSNCEFSLLLLYQNSNSLWYSDISNAVQWPVPLMPSFLPSFSSLGKITITYIAAIHTDSSHRFRRDADLLIWGVWI